jgi:hypothetical protein
MAEPIKKKKARIGSDRIGSTAGVSSNLQSVCPPPANSNFLAEQVISNHQPARLAASIVERKLLLWIIARQGQNLRSLLAGAVAAGYGHAHRILTIWYALQGLSASICLQRPKCRKVTTETRSLLSSNTAHQIRPGPNPVFFFKIWESNSVSFVCRISRGVPSWSWRIDRPTTPRPAPANGRGPSAQSGGAYKRPRLRHGIPAPHRHRARAATATS